MVSGMIPILPVRSHGFVGTTALLPSAPKKPRGGDRGEEMLFEQSCIFLGKARDNFQVDNLENTTACERSSSGRLRV